MIEVVHHDRLVRSDGSSVGADLVMVTKYYQNGDVDMIKLSSSEALHLAEKLTKCVEFAKSIIARD